METAVVSAILNTLTPKIFSLLQDNHNLRRNLGRDIQYIRRELRMIAAAIEDHDRRSWGGGACGDVQRFWVDDVREFAHSIEDCIDRFLHRVTREPDASPLHRRDHRLKTMATRTKFAAEIRELRKRSEEVSRLRERYAVGGEGASAGSTATASSDTDTAAADLVGMDVPWDELLELIREAEDEPKVLKVISIVGFGGLGKTVLARQVYSSVTVGEQHEPCVWVRASEKGAVDVLREILQQVQADMQVHDDNCDLSKLITGLRNCLQSKRFFIVIDDMRTEFWNTIKTAFPADNGVSSRLIVTTAIQSVATACSSVNGHVYVMKTLDGEHSRRLFYKETSLDYYEPAAEQVMNKCDGLPLALVTTAQLLQSKRQLTSKGCADLCRRMGEHVEKEETLARMKHVLLRNYTSLPGHALKACLLYLGIFPIGHPVRRKCLIRRWLAEGFVEADHRRSALDVATDSFGDLMNRSIIRPIDMCNNTEARLPDKIRRLSLHHNNNARDRINSDIDLSLVRSLTVFGKADQDVLKFRKYELLRVLDLEECKTLNDEHLKKICNLLLLRYLSLGGNITMLPKEISKLKFLETLDVRRTQTKILPMPMEVIKLPCLLHLFGVFRLPDVNWQMSKLHTFLSEKSNMETLAGVVADKSLAFPQLLSHMNSLKKVKVWCQSSIDGSNDFTHLSRPIQEFIQRGTDMNDARSLSVEFDGCSQEFLNFHLEDESCCLSSLKIQGKLCSLPPFVTKLDIITELCLSSPDKITGHVLAALSNVRSLHYLKLVTSELEKFVIEQGALRSLRRLCIVARSMAGLENQEGALPHLESLWLLCKDLSGLCGTRIEWLVRLKEIVLDDGVSHETRKEWNEAAKNHLRRPRVSCKANEKVEMDGEPGEICGCPVVTAPEEADVHMQHNKGPEPCAVYRKPAGKLAGLFLGSRKVNELFSRKRKANELFSNKRNAGDSTSTEISCAANGYHATSSRNRGW
ncbi:hypothetical protein ACP70R_029160 [Stipagrostis hirtigluma subsp. patula]